jgi:filamentous hemagglutinin
VYGKWDDVRSGQALAGHGVMDGSAASTQYVSPPGTSVISPRPGIAIADSTGQILEQVTSVEQLETTLTTGVAPNGQVLTPRNYSDLAGYQVTAPGETGYNYTLLSPRFQNKPLNIFGNSTTSSVPTQLSDFLEPNMGCVFWAACTQGVPHIPLK